MHRMLTEKRLARALEDAESEITVDKVSKLIFEAENADHGAYLGAMLSALDCDIDSIDDAELQVIQDAWNYFPHRWLNGKCPAEVMAEMLRKPKA